MSPIESRQTLPAPSLNSIDGLEHLFRVPDESNDTSLRSAGEAVLYLRVSTSRQMNTGSDVDEDGNSIATQRQWAKQKARELNATVVREFVDPGQSAQTIEKRPEFKALLKFIDQNPDVRYVVIYMRSRVFRNHLDAAITKRYLREKNITLVSARENFGDDYMGDAMEAITDVVNELQVRMSGEDIRIKMAHKVERGGSVGRAKLGYLNVRKDFDGRLVNTIDVDPVRSPLIQWAFDEYAKDQVSVWQLANLLEKQGLTTRPSSKRPARPVSVSALAKILRDPYYTGAIHFKGKLYQGRHSPIVPVEVYLAVQEILDRRNRKGDRDQVHFHYLKGVIYCGQCAEAGRSSRLTYTQNKGNGGTYEYYMCSAKQRTGCTIGMLRLEDVEKAVLNAVRRERFASSTMAGIREEVARALDKFQTSDREARSALRAQRKAFEDQETRLIDLAAEGQLPITKIRERLDMITLQKAAINEKLSRTEERMKFGAEQVLAFVDLLERPGELYERVPETMRRDMLMAFFSKLRVFNESDGIEIESDRTEINATLHTWQAQQRLTEVDHTVEKKKRASRISAEGSLTSTTTGLNESNGLGN
ncbi:recombinase family protein [Frigoribacterium sp. 9N]|uniref:recombinase family protein n=1 Tax=Frigoribacterium sp. 9N TaxID=2653144 RepID=UPI001358A1DE|nr:recombinase family protein [Frigoribacterium sp. 9N]